MQTDFAASILHFVNAFNSLTLNDTEVGLFSAVVLYTADRSALTEVKMIEQYQDKFIEALKVQVCIFLNLKCIEKLYRSKINFVIQENSHNTT